MATAKLRGDGSTVAYVATAALSRGDVIDLGSGMVGIVIEESVANGATTELATTGTYEFTKTTGSDTWDANARLSITSGTVASDDSGAHRAFKATAATDTTAWVVINTNVAGTALSSFPVPLTLLRVHDAIQTNLPGTAANDDLAIISGTLGTADPVLQTSDLKNTTGTQYARVQLPLPANYIAGGDVTLVVNGGANTTVASTTLTVDVQAYRNGAGDDLCETAAQSINSLTAADKTFVLTETNLVPGDMLDVRIAVAVADTGTGTAVKGEINKITLKCDVS